MLTVSCKKESINAAVIGGKGRRFVVHSASIITLRIVENDFRLGYPTKPRFCFQYGRDVNKENYVCITKLYNFYNIYI